MAKSVVWKTTEDTSPEIRALKERLKERLQAEINQERCRDEERQFPFLAATHRGH